MELYGETWTIECRETNVLWKTLKYGHANGVGNEMLRNDGVGKGRQKRKLLKCIIKG